MIFHRRHDRTSLYPQPVAQRVHKNVKQEAPTSPSNKQTMSIHTTQITTRTRDTLPLHSPSYINNDYPESKMNNLRTFVHHSIPGSRDIKQFVVQRFSANHEDGLLPNFFKSLLKFFTKSNSSHSLFNSEFSNVLSPFFLFSFSSFCCFCLKIQLQDSY